MAKQTTEEMHQAQQMGAFHQDMLRFTLLQLHDPTLAEDIVQEAISAALANQHSFAGQATLKTWMFSILRNKICDQLRRKKREIQFSELTKEGEALDADFNAHFTPSNNWREETQPQHWHNPEESLEQQQFWSALNACLDNLPPIPPEYL
ncbi:sigma-70 family RNA polymerase sigma factor [Magnetococcus sp. PR-3]|uniref:sigma-70 family RNA polymerase sigma factor n=1 Tax=Magnetococcus sp. PR-3 TaxID=3120355 RepID=UPI002FCDED18